VNQREMRKEDWGRLLQPEYASEFILAFAARLGIRHPQERFVESAKSECLDRLVLLGEGHLRAAVREFVHHYHEERPHQGLGNTLIAPKMTVIGTGQMKRRERLGGLLKFYYRQAA
jgi:transposase InsO family protein